MEAALGLLLFWAGALYLALIHPLVPGWVWGLSIGGLALLLWLRQRREPLFWTGMLWLGWAIGAAFSDLFGLVGLKLVGLGLALALASDLHPRPEARTLGYVLALVGTLVGLFEVGAAGWVGGLFLALGLWLLFRSGGGEENEDPGFSARYRRILAWRRAEAERRGTTVDRVLDDATAAELARADGDPASLKARLGEGREVDAEALIRWLKDSPKG